MLRQVRQLTLVALAFAACTKDAKEEKVTAPVAKQAGALETDTYALAFTSTAAWKAGAEGTASLRVTAKPPLHVNPEYPVSFKPEGSEGVSFAGDRVPLTASTKTPCAAKAEDTCVAEFPLVAKPQKAGPAKLAGVLAFSVCSDEKCLIEKVPVTLAVTAE